MAFVKQNVNPNLSVSLVHAVARLETKDGHLCAVVNSYASLDAYNNAISQPYMSWLNYQLHYQLPVQLNPQVAGDPQAWLISQEGPFAGGELLPENTPLASLQTVRKELMKAERDRLEISGFWYLDKFFDSNQKAYNRMQGAKDIVEYLTAQGQIQGYTIEWTLADDTKLTMTAEQVRGMLPALGAYAGGLHSIYTALKEEIYKNGATEASVLAVNWPT